MGRGRRVRSPGRAPGGLQRVAREARVDAPPFGSPQSSAQVSVQATRPGWGHCPLAVVLMKGNPERATSACCRPGSGVRRDRLCARAFSSLSAGLPPLRLQPRAGWALCSTAAHSAGSLQVWTVALKADPLIHDRRWCLLERGSKTVAGPSSCLRLFRGELVPCASPSNVYYVALTTVKL